MRQLAAACAQQPYRRRAAVGGRRVKVFEHNIKMLPQRMIHQPGGFDIGPRQRANVDNQQVKRLGIGREELAKLIDRGFAQGEKEEL